MTKIKAALMAAAFLAGGALCAESTDEDEILMSEQRNFVIAIYAQSFNLNPQTAAYNSEAEILTALYEGLFSYNPVTLEPENALCKSYKISRDKRRWTFTLRENARFSDGTPITAESVRDSWISLLSNPDASYASLLDCITGAKEFREGKGPESDVKIIARNSSTLVVQLNEPAAHLPSLLCHHAFSAVSKSGEAYSGAFMLKSASESRIEMVKNPNYWGAQSVVIPGITILNNEDSEENSFLFNTGNADWIALGSFDPKKILDKDSIHVSAEFGTAYLFFKESKKKWNTPAFRKALLEAVPYSDLRSGYPVAAKNLVYPLGGYTSPAGIDDYDPEDAAELMEDARKEIGMGSSEEEKISMTFSVPGDYFGDIYNLLKDAWSPLGVELKYEVKEQNEYIDSIRTSDADLFFYSWIGDFADPIAFLELFNGGSSLNVSGYNSSTYNSLLKTGAASVNSQERNKLLSAAEDTLLGDSMVIPVYHPVSAHVIDLDASGGWFTNALDIHPMKYFYIKHQKSSIQNLVRFKN